MTEALTDAQFNKDVEFVRTHSETVYEWALAIRRIKESGKWEEQAETWDEWCRENCGRSASAVRQIIWKENFRQATKMVAATTAEPNEKSAFKEKRLNEPPMEVETKVMPARVDPSGSEIEVNPPPPIVVAKKGLTLIERLDLIERRAYWIMERKDISTQVMVMASRIYAEAREAKTVEQVALPGLTIPSKKRASVEECVDFFREMGLPKSDGEFFHNKCLGSGWKNNGKPIMDWKATARTWIAMALFPSQKQLVNGKVVSVPQSEADRKWERLNKRIQESSE